MPETDEITTDYEIETDPATVTAEMLEEALAYTLRGDAEASLVEELASVLGQDTNDDDAADALAIDEIRTFADGGWLTRDNGLELRLSDGSVFLLTIQRHH